MLAPITPIGWSDGLRRRRGGGSVFLFFFFGERQCVSFEFCNSLIFE